MPKRHLSAQDITAVSIIGLLMLLLLSALTELPIFISLAVSGLFFILIQIYARFISKPDANYDIKIKSEQKRQAALEGEARLANMFSEAIVIINAKSKIVYYNDAAEVLLGVTQTQIPLVSIIRKPNVLNLVSAVQLWQARGKYNTRGDDNASFPQNDTVYHTDSPLERHIRVIATPIDTDDTRPDAQRMMIVFNDITHLVQDNILRADFLANASHELKTPLASLIGYMETLQGHARDDAKARETFLTIMQEQAERMQRLINDLLSLHRIEQSKHHTPTESADLYLAAQAAIEAARPLAQNKNIDLEYEGEGAAHIAGDQDELIQVILNIIDNAINAISPKEKAKAGTKNKDANKGKITLKLFSRSDLNFHEAFRTPSVFEDSMCRRIIKVPNPNIPYYGLHIHDTGPGISREHLPRIAERFYRVITQKQSRSGTGLGLAIVKHILIRHQGGLYVESAAGQGTEFTIMLPVSPANIGESIIGDTVDDKDESIAAAQ